MKRRNQIKTGRFGYSVIGNLNDVLKGSLYNVNVMVLHYFLTFQNKFEGSISTVAKIPLNRSNEIYLLEARTVSDVLEIFNYIQPESPPDI